MITGITIVVASIVVLSTFLGVNAYWPDKYNELEHKYRQYKEIAKEGQMWLKVLDGYTRVIIEKGHNEEEKSTTIINEGDI